MKPACRVGILGLLAALVLLFLPGAVQGQDRDHDRGRFTCGSEGERVTCEADTRDGVRLEEQLSGAPCEEGRSWGFTERGVWVDHGCRATFELRRTGGVLTRIEPGTAIVVRTNRFISSNRSDGRIYDGTVDQDVIGERGRVAIPRGAQVEMTVRVAPDNDLVLDLESVNVAGHRYALDADTERIESQKREGLGGNQRTAEHVGGGAILGSIIGAIAGGGKGAAIGAAAGAGAGAGTEVLTRGRQVKVPAESLLTFRLDRPLVVGGPDRGFDRDGEHFHNR